MQTTIILVSMICTALLPQEGPKEALSLPHFPDRIHAFVWRNWNLVPTERLAKTIGADPSDILDIGTSMGLPSPPPISEEQLSRTYITIIRANWHLLPFEQMLILLNWDESRLSYTLREDDFLYIKLGSIKPACKPLAYSIPDESTKERARKIKDTVVEDFGATAGTWQDPPLKFIERLCAPAPYIKPALKENRFEPRFCYSYFALYGDPFLEQDPFPDGYLQRLAEIGVNGVWLHSVLYKLSPFPWAPELSENWQARLKALNAMTERAANYGIGIYLYLNEPRAMPLAFFETHPELRGVTENDYAALCTGNPEVSAYLTEATARICSAAPKLAGFLTITASENLTNCWSHFGGANCPRCASRGPAEAVAGVNQSVADGIEKAGSNARLFAWDWGWSAPWAQEAIKLLPKRASLMSVSEWEKPITRGGIETSVGEYSISTIGPGPRAIRHWELARETGLASLAKIQANTTWELGALPYIPAVTNVARHVEALRDCGVSGLMLGWTLGGYPSPNLEVVRELGEKSADGNYATAHEALLRVAARRFGEKNAKNMSNAWETISNAFSEFPYHGGVVYNAPLQIGPANLLWASSTGYQATMVGLPYDDLASWRAVYPADIFISQLEKVANGFMSGVREMRSLLSSSTALDDYDRAIMEESNLAEAAALHYLSIAQQGKFILLRDKRATVQEPDKKQSLLADMRALLLSEKECAKALYQLQTIDSRIGFEATNHYFYTPADLVEKVINCTWLLESM